MKKIFFFHCVLFLFSGGRGEGSKVCEYSLRRIQIYKIKKKMSLFFCFCFMRVCVCGGGAGVFCFCFYPWGVLRGGTRASEFFYKESKS